MSASFSSPHDPPPISPTALDDLYRDLKEYDSQWLAEVLQARWSRVGAARSTKLATRSNGRVSVTQQQHTNSLAQDVHPVWPFDITLPVWPCDRPLTEHEHAVRNHDWANTSLGPMATWSGDIRKIVNLVMTDPRPSAAWFGEDRTLVYNEKYAVVLGGRHPGAIGQPFINVWPELKPFFDEKFDIGLSTGMACSGENALFMTDRNGFREELWASWNIIPVPCDEGINFFNPVVETTRQALTERRLSALLNLGSCLATATDIEGFWKLVVKGLESSQYDVPFAAFYAASHSDSSGRQSPDPQWDNESMASTDGSNMSTKQWILQGTIGLPVNCLPSRVNAQTSPGDFLPNLQEMLVAGRTTMLSINDGTFPPTLEGVARSTAFDEDVTGAVFCPVGPTHRENILGFMILGLNPCHQYDRDYDQFFQLLVRQMSTSLASMVLTEEERKRSQAAIAQATEARLRLSEQLVATQQKAVEVETRFRKMSDMAPVGIFHMAADGKVIYANECWYELTQHPRDLYDAMSWRVSVHTDDIDMVDKQWERLAKGDSVNFEMRFKKPFVTQDYKNGEPVQGDTYVIASAYADKAEDGTLRGVFGCLTDISRQKWMEGLQARRVEEATELRRQQERFMDMTSHETRNPLGSIMLSSESILSTLRELVESPGDPICISRDTVETHLVGAETIMACCQHQKRIIDDVLTLSKVDSGLLVVSPIEVQPEETVGQALKMLEYEAERGDISLQLIITDAYRALNIDWVKLDPTRILQVLINLLANAIKFTRSKEGQRSIKVTLNASLQRPVSSPDGVHYLDQSLARSVSAASANVDDLYLSVAVSDTGPGIPPDELKKLFQRFQQAYKTHVDYGGSGLGLFVSRELVKLQGGDMGVASEVGKGSTFKFFVHTTRCLPPLIKRSQSHSLTAAFVGADLTSRHLSPRLSGDKNLTGTIAKTAGLHILLCEDNLVNQRVMSMQLKRAGFHIQVANHGQEALEYLRQSRFCSPDMGHPLDLVLLDVEMPIMDGLDCIRAIRKLQRSGHCLGHVPVIAVTANARAEQQAVALEAGMDSVICKPFRMSELHPEIQRVYNLYPS